MVSPGVDFARTAFISLTQSCLKLNALPTTSGTLATQTFLYILLDKPVTGLVRGFH